MQRDDKWVNLVLTNVGHNPSCPPLLVCFFDFVVLDVLRCDGCTPGDHSRNLLDSFDSVWVWTSGSTIYKFAELVCDKPCFSVELG